MNKPLLQKLIENIVYLGLGLLLLGNFLDAIGNAFAFINFSIALWTTIVVFALYSILLIFFRKRKVKWVSKEGNTVTILNLGKKLKLPILGALVLLWGPVVFDFFKSNPKPLVELGTKNSKPIFDSADKRFKILVLPFQNECEYLGTKYDIGNVICKRLEKLNREDTLNLITYFFSDSMDFSNFTPEKADSMMKYHHANQIVYGSYSLKQCEGGSSDKICFNYRIDKTKFNVGQRDNTNYNMISMPGLESIRNGSGQEEIDNIVYSFAGASAYMNKKWKTAIQKFEKIKNISDYSIIEYSKVFCYFQLKEYGIVKNLCLNKLKVSSNNDLFWNTLGMAYYELKQYSKAKECYNKSLIANPNSAYAWNNLGCFYLNQADLESAKIYFEKAISLNPKIESAWNGLGNFYLQKLNFYKAKESFENAININPFSTYAFANLALNYFNLKDTTNALTYYKKVIEIDSNDWRALSDAGSIYLELGEYDNAKKYLERSIQINPNNDIAWSCLGLSYQKSSDCNSAIEFYKKALKINSNNKRAMVRIGQCYFLVKDTINAIMANRAALKANPMQSDVLYNLGLMYINIDKKKSLFYLRKALVIDPLLKPKLRELILTKFFMNIKEFSEFFN